jgi:uncharacterized repeat protein (TIGR01451 family)
MLFYADDAFRVEDGSLLELESPVNAEQFVAGKDGRLYLRDQHTVMQWELDGTRVKILESAQWDYTKFVGRGWVPDEAGVTEKGVIWTSYEDGNRVALMDGTGQLLGTVDSGLAGGDVVALLEPDLTLYVCGMEHFRTSRPYPYCRAFEPRTEEAIWEVELDVGQEVKGGVLVPGRLYVTTDQGLLYSIGQAPKTAQAEPAATVGKDRSPAPTPTAVRPTAAETEPEVTSAVPQPTLAPTAFPSVSVAAGAHMTVTIPVINQGPSDARRVIVTSTLPTGFALMSANASQGTGCDESDGQLVCQIGDLRNGAGAAITVVFGVDTTAAGIITYTSSVASSATDPDVLNNTQSRRAAVRGAADLSLLFIDAPDSAMAGLPFSYTLAIRNKGPEDATGVTITSTLPVSTTFVSATDDPDLTCTESDGSMTCTRAELAAGAGFSLQLVVSVDPSYVGTVNYRIYISAKEPDFEPWDNAVEKATVIDAEADLTIREMP